MNCAEDGAKKVPTFKARHNLFQGLRRDVWLLPLIN